MTYLGLIPPYDMEPDDEDTDELEAYWAGSITGQLQKKTPIRTPEGLRKEES